MRKMHDCDVNTSIEASYFSNGEESTSVAGADEGDACVLNAKAAVEKGGEKKKKKSCSSFAPAQNFLHLLLHVFHLLSPLLTQTFLIISNNGGVAHKGDEADAKQVGEARAKVLHSLAISLGVLQIDLQDWPAEELAFTHHTIVQRVQVLVPQVIGIALFEVVLLALTVLWLRIHHFHELPELVLQVLLHTRVLAIQGFLLDLYQCVAVHPGQLVQPPVHRVELALQSTDVFVVNVVQHHPDQRASHTKNGVDHSCRRGDGIHTLEHFDQALL